MLLRRTYGAPVAAVSMSVEGETAAYAAAVVANGGTVSDARVAILNTFIRAEKASGAWALTDDYWALWAESEAQALTSLKQRRLATVVAAPTFTADAGYAFNGTSQYLNTNFISSTHAAAMTGTNQRVSVYERTDVNVGNAAIGAVSSGTSNIRLTPRASGNMVGTLNSNASSRAIADSTGYSTISRASGGTTILSFRDGVKLTDVPGLTVGTALPQVALYIGARNNVGTADSFRASTLGFAAVGAPLSEAQELSQYNAVQAWATAIGANV